MATLFSKAFVCPLTCDIMDDPVVLSDGVSYERRAAAEWCAACSRSPVTGEALVGGVAVPNTVLRAAIQRWRQTPKWGADVRAAELCAVRAECAALEAARVHAEHRLARATERLTVTQDRASSANGAIYELRLKTETVTQALRVAKHQNEAAVYQAVLDHIRAERWEDAIVVSEKHKRNPQLAAVRGFAFQRMKNYASAMKEYQRALEMDNRNVVALNGMASLCSVFLFYFIIFLNTFFIFFFIFSFILSFFHHSFYYYCFTNYILCHSSFCFFLF